MAALKVPEPYWPGILWLASATESAYQELLNALKRSPTSFVNRKEVTAWISSEVPSLSVSDIARLVDTLTSLYRVRVRRDVAVPALSNDVLEAAREGIPGFKVTAGVDFESRLSALLSLESLNIITSKAKELQTACERTFCDVKMLTDIRPIFAEDAIVSPTDAVVIHTLKIGYHDSISKGHKDFFVALDDTDIESLIKVLHRSKEKSRSLKPVIERAGMRSIDLT